MQKHCELGEALSATSVAFVVGIILVLTIEVNKAVGNQWHKAPNSLEIMGRGCWTALEPGLCSSASSLAFLNLCFPIYKVGFYITRAFQNGWTNWDSPWGIRIGIAGL